MSSSLPSASTRLSDQSGTAPISTDLVAVIAPVPGVSDGVPVLYSSLSALIDAHGYSEGAEYAGLHMDGAGKPVLYVPIPIATAGTMARQASTHTGTSNVTAAVGSSGALAEVHAYVSVKTGGTVGTDQILLTLSLDGDTSTKTVRLGTNTTYTIPSIGVVLTFGAGTLVAGDTVLEFQTVGPAFDATGVTLAKTQMAAQQKVMRTWLFVGTVGSLALGQAIESAVNAYETASERFVVAKFQARDRRVSQNSKQRCAMVGSNSITFAEVGATGDTITRVAGSFITDGFQVGDYIRVTGAVATAGYNNVSGKITGVTATVLTLDTADLIAEAGVTTVAITGEPSFVFDAAGKTITRNRGSWTVDGFAVGDSVTVAGSASNNGTHVITTLTATVMTVAASVLVAETAGSCTVSVTLTESETAWMASINTMFAAISSSARVDIGAGRLTHLSTITGFTPRWPVQWADSIRSYQIDIGQATWEKDRGVLDGWGIDGEHDERVNEGLIDGRFTCARTWSNGPVGAFIAKAITRATDGSILGMTHNMYVANVVQAVCQRVTENFAGKTLILKSDGTATPASLADLKAKVDAELQRNVLSNIGGSGPRASSVAWNPATDDDLRGESATLHGNCPLKLKGTIVHIATTVEVS